MIDLRLEFISILNLTLAVNIFVKYKCKNTILPQIFLFFYLKQKTKNKTKGVDGVTRPNHDNGREAQLNHGWVLQKDLVKYFRKVIRGYALLYFLNRVTN